MRQRVRETIEAIVKRNWRPRWARVKSARVGDDAPGLSAWDARADADDESGADDDRDAAGARAIAPTGRAAEWRSETVRAVSAPHERVDEAILGVYLRGRQYAADQGRVGAAAAGRAAVEGCGVAAGGPLARGFRDVARAAISPTEDIRYVFMDGWYPKVRIGGRRERVPVLVTLGVRANGERVVLDLRLVGEESAASWTRGRGAVSRRGTWRGRCLAVIDGNPGLTSALRSHWPGMAIQRCTAHKLRNLQAKAPARLREELTEDYRRMIYGETVTAVEQARTRFTKKWRLRCPAVVESLEEAGDELFTFLRFPSSQWKALRTTNALERINEEFRRRTKTQASLPSQDAVLLLLFGLLRSGQVKLRALVGYHDMEHVKKAA